MTYDLNNPQSVFDFIVRALIAQGKPSVGSYQKKVSRSYPDYGEPDFEMIEDYGCMYRSPDGCKCAAGHMIPDEKYDLSMEGRIFSAIAEPAVGLQRKAWGKSDPNGRTRAVISRLQEAHDGAAFDEFPSPNPERLVSDEEFLKGFWNVPGKSPRTTTSMRVRVDEPYRRKRSSLSQGLGCRVQASLV